MAKEKTRNEVTLLGYIKTKIVPQDNGRAFVEGSLSTTLRKQQEEGGKWENVGDPQWHTIIPMNKEAATSLRSLGTSLYALVRGTYRRREYEVQGKRRFANEILVFNPIEVAEPGRKNKILVHGFLGRKPHIAYPVNGGPALMEFAVATHASKRDPSNQNGWIDIKTWHKCYCRAEDLTVETVLEHLRGKKFVRIEGELLYRKTTLKDGEHRAAEIKMSSIDDIEIPPIVLPADNLILPETPEAKFEKMAKEMFKETPAQETLPFPTTGNSPVVIIPLGWRP